MDKWSLHSSHMLAPLSERLGDKAREQRAHFQRTTGQLRARQVQLVAERSGRSVLASLVKAARVRSDEGASAAAKSYTPDTAATACVDMARARLAPAREGTQTTEAKGALDAIACMAGKRSLMHVQGPPVAAALAEQLALREDTMRAARERHGAELARREVTAERAHKASHKAWRAERIARVSALAFRPAEREAAERAEKVGNPVGTHVLGCELALLRGSLIREHRKVLRLAPNAFLEVCELRQHVRACSALTIQAVQEEALGRRVMSLAETKAADVRTSSEERAHALQSLRQLHPVVPTLAYHEALAAVSGAVAAPPPSMLPAIRSSVPLRALAAETKRRLESRAGAAAERRAWPQPARPEPDPETLVEGAVRTVRYHEMQDRGAVWAGLLATLPPRWSSAEASSPDKWLRPVGMSVESDEETNFRMPTAFGVKDRVGRAVPPSGVEPVGTPLLLDEQLPTQSVLPFAEYSLAAEALALEVPAAKWLQQRGEPLGNGAHIISLLEQPPEWRTDPLRLEPPLPSPAVIITEKENGEAAARNSLMQLQASYEKRLASMQAEAESQVLPDVERRRGEAAVRCKADMLYKRASWAAELQAAKQASAAAHDAKLEAMEAVVAGATGALPPDQTPMWAEALAKRSALEEAFRTRIFEVEVHAEAEAELAANDGLAENAPETAKLRTRLEMLHSLLSMVLNKSQLDVELTGNIG